MEAVRAVVFDLDGTLLDHAASARAGLSTWLAQRGVEATDDLQRAWRTAEERHFATWRAGEISFAEQRRRRLRDVLPLLGAAAGGLGDDPPTTDAALDAAFAGYLTAYEAAWVAFDDAGAGVDGVRALGLRTAVLTNGTEAQQRAKLARLGLLERIGPVLTAEALGVAKPSPTAFGLLVERLALAPQEVLHVGDDHPVDVLAARAAGLRAVHLDRTGAGPLDERSRITGLRELPAVVAALRGPSA